MAKMGAYYGFMVYFDNEPDYKTVKFAAELRRQKLAPFAREVLLKKAQKVIAKHNAKIAIKEES